MRHLGVPARAIDIRPLCLEAFRELGHAPFGIDADELDVETFRAGLPQVPAGAAARPGLRERAGPAADRSCS